MLLVLGDSVAFWAGRRCVLGGGIRATGWRGGRIGDHRFRSWAIETALKEKPQQVLLTIGGNDLTAPVFNTRILSNWFEELTAGLLAAGAEKVWVMSIQPRTSHRPGDVAVSVFRRRRRLMNLVLRRQFSRSCASPQVVFAPFTPPDNFIGRDGVHPSAEGWQALATFILTLAPV